MRRVILSLLILLLPLQFSWAVAASYCQHEDQVESRVQPSAGGGVSHFGHHEHEHQAAQSAHAGAGSVASERGSGFPEVEAGDRASVSISTDDGGSSADKSAPGKLAVDPDCATCHASPGVVPAAPAPHVAGFVASSLRPSLAEPCESLPRRAPDRPQWLRLA